MIIMALIMPLMTSCETIKETFSSLGVTDKIKAAAKDWINKKIDELDVPKTSPKLVVEADKIGDTELQAEVLSQLKAPVAYSVKP